MKVLLLLCLFIIPSCIYEKVQVGECFGHNISNSVIRVTELLERGILADEYGSYGNSSHTEVYVLYEHIKYSYYRIDCIGYLKKEGSND